MKEYTITMKFQVESDESDYEQISEYAEQLCEDIMNDDKLVYQNDIEIVGISIDDVEDNSSYDEDNLYLDDDE